MRIVVVTQQERLYLPIAIDRVLEALGGEVVGLIELPSFNEGTAATGKRFLRLYGLADFLKLGFLYAGASGVDLIQKMGLPGGISRSVATAARRKGIPFRRVADINGPEALRLLQDEWRPDLLLSIAASQRFHGPLLQLPPLGCINLHSSPLPKYRGMMPNFWAMAHGENPTQVTVHTMAEALDAGQALVQLPVEIPPGDSLHRLMQRSKRVGAEALVQAVALLRNGRAEGKALHPEEGSYFSFPTPQDVRRLRDRGFRLI